MRLKLDFVSVENVVMGFQSIQCLEAKTTGDAVHFGDKFGLDLTVFDFSLDFNVVRNLKSTSIRQSETKSEVNSFTYSDILDNVSKLRRTLSGLGRPVVYNQLVFTYGLDLTHHGNMVPLHLISVYMKVSEL